LCRLQTLLNMEYYGQQMKGGNHANSNDRTTGGL
jgi:hypothetical protein